MSTERYPVHIHLHPHGTIADYDGVKALIANEEDPFLLFMPEVADGSPLLAELQQISDGNKRLLNIHKRYDMVQNGDGVLTDVNAARARALAEAVYDSGIGVVGVHPNWDEQTMLDNAVVLGKRNPEPTFQGAIEAMRCEFPQIATIIDRRDEFTASVFLERAEAAVAKTPEFEDADQVPCLVEIGSLHFGLAERLSEEGFAVTTSGEGPDNLLGTQEQAIAHLLRGGSVFDLDLERMVIEGALHNFIQTESSVTTQAAVDRVMASLSDRAQWPALYEDTVANLGL